MELPSDVKGLQEASKSIEDEKAPLIQKLSSQLSFAEKDRLNSIFNTQLRLNLAISKVLQSNSGIFALANPSRLGIDSKESALFAVVASLIVYDDIQCIGTDEASPLWCSELNWPTPFPQGWNKGNNTFGLYCHLFTTKINVVSSLVNGKGKLSSDILSTGTSFTFNGVVDGEFLVLKLQSKTGVLVEFAILIHQFTDDSFDFTTNLRVPFVEHVGDDEWKDITVGIVQVNELHIIVERARKKFLLKLKSSDLAKPSTLESHEQPPNSERLRNPPFGIQDPRVPGGFGQGPPIGGGSGIAGPGGFGDDLLPGGGLGTGGMLFGPGHPYFDGRMGGGRGGRGPGFGGVPAPGVPPGARFDPFGPSIDTDGSDGVPRRGSGFGPNPDHLKPPGF